MSSSFASLTDRVALVGVLHLPPLPGSPRPGPGMQAVIDHALRDAETLAEGGADGLIVENLGDAPFDITVEPHVTAALAVVAHAVQQRLGPRQFDLWAAPAAVQSRDARRVAATSARTPTRSASA